MFVQRRIWIGILSFALLLVLTLTYSQTIVSAPPIVPTPTPTRVGKPTTQQIKENPPPARSAIHAPRAVLHIGNGPFGPPDADDSVFTRDSAPTMDEYRFRSQSPVIFTIPVDRVLGKTNSEGYLLEPDKLIQNGILSAKARLRLLVWDVDEDYSGTGVVREIDKVYINGHYIGNLSGANDTWSVTRIDFDIRYLKFAKPTCNEDDTSHLETCHNAPTTVQNEIRIDIDTGNSGADVWAVTVDWGAISFDAARPILFVHGKGGDNNGGGYDYWDKYDGQYYFNFRGKLSSAGFLTAITENRLVGEGSIAENAQILKTIIGELKTRYGVRKVNLVGHSKGGLDSRGYISDSSLNSTNDVETLISLSSPHHGVYLADLARDHSNIAALLGQSQTDALGNVSESFVNDTFNPRFPAREGVRYYSIAADAGQDYWYGRDIPIWQVLSLPEVSQRVGAPMTWAILRSAGKYKGENDFLVTVNSMKWDGVPGHTSNNSYNFGPYSLNHHSIRAAEKQAGQLDNTVSDLIKSLLDIRSGSSGTWQPLKSASPVKVTASTSSSPDSSLSSSNGSISQGQTLNRTVGIDSNSRVSFSLLWQNGDLYLNLVDPVGNVITPGTVNSNITYSEDRSGGNLNSIITSKVCVYNIINPQPGQWTARIVAGASLPGGQSDWALLTSQDSPLTMSLATDQSWHKLNDQVLVTATLKNGTSPLLDAGVQLVIVTPSGGSQTLTLYDNGTNGDVQANDGVYTNRFTVTQFGRYRLSADATGTTETSIPFKRTAVSELEVGSGSAALSTGYSDSGVDSNGDGLYDWLRINVPVIVTTGGQYRVFGKLYDSNNAEMGWTDGTLNLVPGNNTAPLDFSGSVIWARNGQGTFTLRELRLIERSTNLQVDYQENAYTTQSYSRSQFQHAAVGLTGINSDFGTDTNGNGKYDILTVNIGIYAEQAGNYTWNARLVDANDYEFGWSSSSGYLPAGNQFISFTFDGKMISAHQVNGPYYIKDLVFWGNSGYVSVINVASTTSYNYSQFEPAPSSLFLPLVSKNVTSQTGIYGRVTQSGVAASGISLELRFYNGSTWSTYATTTTGSDGRYSFTGVPSLSSGQRYYVRYSNPGGTYNGRLWFWGTRELTSYTAGSNVAIGDFDIADIALVSPSSGATVTLPYTFQWTRRTATPSDSYEFDLFDPSDSNPWWWTYPTLGYVGNYTLNSLPTGFSPLTQYGWDVWVYSPDGGVGESYYFRTVTFSNTGSGSTLMLPAIPRAREDVPYR